MNFYGVGKDTDGAGVLVPLQTDVPHNVDCGQPVYFFSTSRDALRFYNAVYCRTAGGEASSGNQRAQQRQKRQRLKRQTERKKKCALATPVVCIHANRDACACYATWKARVLANKTCCVKDFKRAHRHQGELQYFAFVWQPPASTTVATHLLTCKVSWEKIRPSDKVVVLHFHEKTIEQLN